MKSIAIPSPQNLLVAPLTTREQQALARRAQILETALQLFARQGFDGTSTKQIAQQIGIAEGLIFHYFPTKADLLNAILETPHSFIGDLRTLLEDAGDQSTTLVLHNLASGWLNTLRREKEITLVVFNTAQTNPKVGAMLQSLIGEGVRRLATYLRARIAASELRKDLPVETSALTFFSSLMIFFLVNHKLPQAEWDQQSTSFIQEMLSLWTYGAHS